MENELQFRLWTNALRRLEYGEKLLNNFEKSRDWLEKLSKEQGDDIQRACLSPTLHSNFQFGESVILVRIFKKKCIAYSQLLNKNHA